MLAVLAALSFVSSTPDDFADNDHDGLLDRWETNGVGPIDPQKYDCKPGRADVFIVFARFSDVTVDEIKPTVDKIAAYFASLPYKNPDGSTGLHLIPVFPPALDKQYDGKSYTELYKVAMPPEWRGLAHGVMVGKSKGGGGQTNRADWCGTGNNFPTIIHELGHQFGLGHNPPAGTGSPFHTSFMNYDYSYQFDNDPNKIHYSNGQFADMAMKENDLHENVDHSAAELHFLTQRPYYFKVKDLGNGKASVDWNRNGVFGETHVRADINDGYSQSASDEVELDYAAGSPTLVSTGKTLLAVYPAAPSSADPKAVDATELTSESPGRILVQAVEDHKVAKPVEVASSGVIGEISACWSKGRLWIAYPTKSSLTVARLNFDGKTFGTPDIREFKLPGQVPALVDTPSGPLLLAYNPADQTVSFTSADQESPVASLPGFTSQSPVSAVWNSIKNCLAVAGTNRVESRDNRAFIQEFTLKEGTATPAKLTWVEGPKGSFATLRTPRVLFDAGKDRGPQGAYLVYVHGKTKNPDDNGLTYVSRQIQDPSLSDGWRTKMMINEWSYTNSVCGVALHNNDIAYAVRFNTYVPHNHVRIWLQASGIENRLVTDFDEVGHIFNVGLQNSLQQVRAELRRKS